MELCARMAAARIVNARGAAAGIGISLVTAQHDNAVPADLLTGSVSDNLAAQGLVYEVGDPAGYLGTFTNRLTVCS